MVCEYSLSQVYDIIYMISFNTNIILIPAMNNDNNTAVAIVHNTMSWVFWTHSLLGNTVRGGAQAASDLSFSAPWR